jgi:hypothetical protein
MKINSLEKYVIEINEIITKWRLCNSTTHTWFRGQDDKIWKLVPKIYRNVGFDFILEREYFRDFKLLANNYLDKLPLDDFEWMFIMQHYGMPTRLLDWTESHLVALFFVVENYKNSKDGAVWILDPWSLNEATMGEFTVPVHNHRFLNDYVLPPPMNVEREVRGYYPVCIRPKKSTSRILAQKGCFSIHGNIQIGIDEITSMFNKSENQIKKIRLKKIIIDGRSKLKILKQLFISGITHSVIFPDLDGLSKEISLRYSEDYMNSGLMD